MEIWRCVRDGAKTAWFCQFESEGVTLPSYFSLKMSVNHPKIGGYVFKFEAE